MIGNDAVLKDGTVSDLAIQQSCGNPAYDEAAKAFVKAVQFKPLPNRYKGDQLQFVIRMDSCWGPDRASISARVETFFGTSTMTFAEVSGRLVFEDSEFCTFSNARLVLSHSIQANSL